MPPLAFTFGAMLIAVAAVLVLLARVLDHPLGSLALARALYAFAAGLVVVVPVLLLFGTSSQLGSAPVAYRSNFTVTGACAKAGQ